MTLPPESRNEMAFLVSFAVNATSNQILASGSTMSGPGQRKPPLLFSPLCRLKGGGSENLKEGGVGPLSGCVKQSPAPPLDCKRVRNHGACCVGPTTRGLSVSSESTRPVRLHGSPFEVINPAFSVQERHPTLLSF